MNSSSLDKEKNASGSKLNAGLDIYCIQTKTYRYLNKIRAFFLKHGDDYNGIIASKINKAQLRELKKLNKKFPIINFFPNSSSPKYLQKSNEFLFLKKNLAKNKKLTISQKAFTYSQAYNYTFKQNPICLNELSWQIAINMISDGIGQEKIGKILGYSRESINQKIKKIENIKVKQRFVLVSKNLHHQNKSKKKVIGIINKHKFGGYRTDAKGNLYRQIANKYNNKKLLKIIKYDDRSSFYYSNKELNKALSGKTDSSLPVVKKIIAKRSARKLIYLKKISKTLNRKDRKRIGLETRSVIGSNDLLNHTYDDKGNLTNIYPKLKREIEKLQKEGIKINQTVLKALTIYKAKTVTRKGNSFKMITNKQFRNYLNLMRTTNILKNDFNMKMKEKRLILNFQGFTKRQAGFMC